MLTSRVCVVSQVTVLFAGQHISKSPFEVDVGMAQGDSSKVTAQGPGLEPSGNIANKTTYFDVYTAGSLQYDTAPIGLLMLQWSSSKDQGYGFETFRRTHKLMA